MKNLNECPTPITDDFCAKLDHKTNWEKWQLTASKCADLERKLAACRVFIRDSIDYSHIEEMHKPSAEQTLAATAP